MSYLSLFSEVPCTKIGHYIEQSVNFLTRMTSTIQSPNCLYFSSLPSEEVINYPNDLARKGNHCQKLRVSIPWTEKAGGCSPWGRWGLDTTEWLQFHFSLSCIGEGNSNPLQHSHPENPRDEGARWATVYGVAQIRTWLKGLSSIASSRGRVFLRGGAEEEGL